MNTSKSKTRNTASAKDQNAKKSSSGKKELLAASILSSQLMKLFEDELKDIYWVEKALVKAIPKMIKQATSEELAESLEAHLEETKEQVTRVEQVFEAIGKKATAKKCEAMEGLIR